MVGLVVEPWVGELADEATDDEDLEDEDLPDEDPGAVDRAPAD